MSGVCCKPGDKKTPEGQCVSTDGTYYQQSADNNCKAQASASPPKDTGKDTGKNKGK
jgi:hypothetical protein